MFTSTFTGSTLAAAIIMPATAVPTPLSDEDFAAPLLTATNIGLLPGFSNQKAIKSEHAARLA